MVDHTVNPLDGVVAKMARASAHLNEVKAAVQEMSESEPDLVPGEFDRQNQQYVFRA